MTTWKSVIILGFFVAYLGCGGRGAQAQGLEDVAVTSSGCSLSNFRIVAISMSEAAIVWDLTMTRGEECDINATWPQGFECEADSLSWQRSSSFSCTTGSPPTLVETEIVSPWAARWTLSAPSDGSDCSGKIWLYVRNPTTCLTIVLDVTVLEGPEVLGSEVTFCTEFNCNDITVTFGGVTNSSILDCS
ncbi:MAG: hypothetical protein JRJ00_08015 [Deltaproteobacteria bacterium]|nr:hypothetical protein [Deltaproteobacteria bacterium]